MSKYVEQFPKEIYEDEFYDSLSRFVSYYNQKKIIIDIAKKDKEHTKILEVGKGNGLISEYLKQRGYDIKTFDNTDELNPDYIGDITHIQDVVEDKFDIISCFEVLEHIRYRDVENVLKQFSEITENYLLVSLPQYRFSFTLWAEVSFLPKYVLYFDIPFLKKKHKFDGAHYWELGKEGYSLKDFRILLSKFFYLEREFTHPLNAYHRFFILKKII